ncbi:MAG: hypothetical protein CL833_05395, partial [Crocinitomicaceae bacterium]|nr:hypothetical protein [Crocinitomicaceae bacterium]
MNQEVAITIIKGDKVMSIYHYNPNNFSRSGGLVSYASGNAEYAISPYQLKVKDGGFLRSDKASVVTHKGSTFICKKDAQDIEPGVSPNWRDYWTLISSGVGGGAQVSVRDEGVLLTNVATGLNFVGLGVTATNNNDLVTVTIPSGGPIGPTGPTGPLSTVPGPTGPIGQTGPIGPSGRIGEPGGNCQTFIYYTGIDTIPHSEVAASGHLSLYTPSIDVPQNSKAVIFDYFNYASSNISGWGDTFSHPGQVKIFKHDDTANYAVYELTQDTSTSLGLPWPQLKDACQNGGTVNIKYSFIAAGNTSSDGHIQGQNSTYQLQDYNDSSVTFAAFTGEIGAALEEWKGLFESVYPNLTLNFTNMGEEVTNTVRSDTYGGTYAIPHPDCSNIGDFRFGMHKIDHAGNVLAHGYSPGGILGVSGNHGGDIHFDYAEDWRTDTTNNTFNHNNDPNAFSIKYVAAHEVGHAFGLGHDSDSSSILYPSVTSATNFYQSFPSGLKHSLVERRAVERVYGEADYNRKYITFLDGNLNLNDSDLVSM